MALQNFGPTASPVEIAAATLKDGAAIVSGLVPASLAETVAGELRDNLDTFGYRSRRDFSGHHTNRCHAVLIESPSSVALIGHDMVMDVADALLLPHCESYRIGSITAIEVCPGQKVQNLHRDNCIYPVSLPMELARTYDERMRRLLGYTTHDKLGDRLGKYYGSDSSFIDKDDYANYYRPYPPELKGKE